MREFIAPQRIYNTHQKTIFLAGTIDMGQSYNWQSEFARWFEFETSLTVYNPRRKDWDSTWKQEFENGPFFQQVIWELDALERADYIVVNFLKDSKSPISMLELGKFHQKCIVLCPKGFYRRGNIEIFCYKYDIPLFDAKHDLFMYLKRILK